MTRGRKIVAVILIIVLIPIAYVSVEWAYNAGPLAPYLCPPFSYNTSKFSECRVFTQTGQATLQTDWTGRVLATLYLKDAPAGTHALWLANANTTTILVRFPNGSSVTCTDGQGPCSIGIV